MDFFGLGQGVRGAMEVYFRAARRTGRTQRLVQNLNEGDRVFTHSSQEARRIRDMARDRGIHQLDVIPVDRPTMQRMHDVMFRMGQARGKVIIDHMLLEEIYKREVLDIGTELARWEARSGMAPPKERPQLNDGARWEI
jgi:hypothetical protein